MSAGRKPWLLWVLLGTGVVLIVVVLVVVFALNSDPDTDSAQGTAEAVADALSDRDAAALNVLLCDPADRIGQGGLTGQNVGASDLSVSSVDVRGDSATATLIGTMDGKRTELPIPLTRQDGRWCLGG